VRAVTEAVELFPYDLLIVATHCGDADGYRWTYEYKDYEGVPRTFVVDIALGVGQTDDEEMLDGASHLRPGKTPGGEERVADKQGALAE
jgi:hypothetical protein